MMGEDEHRGVKRRIVSPPALPLGVWPGAALRREFIPAHDLRADARPPGGGKRVVHAAAAAGLALHGMEATGGEKPFVQPGTRMPERGIQALPLAGAEPVQRHRKVVHPHPRHGVLLHNDVRRSAGWLREYTARIGKDRPLWSNSSRRGMQARHPRVRPPQIELVRNSGVSRGAHGCWSCAVVGALEPSDELWVDIGGAGEPDSMGE